MGSVLVCCVVVVFCLVGFFLIDSVTGNFHVGPVLELQM